MDRADRLTLTVPEVAQSLGIGRNRVYDLIAAGDLPSVRFGRLIRVPRTSLEQWLDTKTKEQK